MAPFARLFALLALLLGAGVALVPAEAQAKGLMIINTGEDFFETGPLEELAQHADPKLRNLKAGYMCSVFGVFWAYFHKWDCKPVLFEKVGDTYNYIDHPDAQAMVTAKYSEKDMKLGFWAAHGRWIFAGVILLLIVFSILRRGGNRAA